MTQQRQPVVGAVLLTILALLSCAAYVSGTVTVTRSVFTWEATRSGEPAPLVLAAQSPEQLSANGPCEMREQQPRDLVLTGAPGEALTVRTGHGQVWMEYGGRPVGIPLQGPRDCTLSLQYSRFSNTALLRVGDENTEAALVPPQTTQPPGLYQQFAVTGLWAAPGIEVSLTTQPSTFSSSGWRLIWLILCLGCLLVLGLRLRSQSTAVPTATASRWSLSDTVVAVVGAISMVVVPPRFDDGWVLTTVRQYADLGFFSNYYSNDAVAQPQGFWWTWLERLWLSGLGTPGFLLRLPTVLRVVGTWWVMRRKVLIPLGLNGTPVAAGAAVACASMIGLQVTIRPEPMIAILMCAAIATVMRYARTRSPHLLVLLVGLSAFALAAHQTGWVVVTASCAVLPWTRDWLRTPGAPVVLAATMTIGAAACLLLMTLGSNWPLWLRSVRAFRRDTTTYQSLLDEGDRIAAVATRADTPAITMFAVAVLLLSVLGFLLRERRGDAGLQAAGWSAVAGMGGLFLTSSKLTDHYAAVVPASVLLTAIAVASIRRSVAIGAIVAIAMTALAAVLGGGLWALGSDRVTLLKDGAWPAVAGVGLILLTTAALIALFGRLSPSRAVTGMLAIASACAVALSLMPVVIEGLQQPGSWFGQQIGVLSGRTCGLVDTVTVNTPSVGTFATPATDASPAVIVGTGAVAWGKGPLFGVITSQVELENGEQRQVLLASGADVWRLLPLPTSANTLSVHQPGVAVAVDQNPVTAPASRLATSEPDVWWIEPGLGLQVPCLRSVSIADGTVSGVLNSVGRPSWVGAGVLRNSPLVYETGCAGKSLTGTGACLVSIAPASAGLVGQTVMEKVG